MAQITEATSVASTPAKPMVDTHQASEIRYYTASQFQLMWWKFKKHRLVLIGSALLGVFVFIALFAEFLAPYVPGNRSPEYLYGPPQTLHFVNAEGKFQWRPYTNALTLSMNRLGELPEAVPLAARAIAIGVIANTVLKMGVAGALGSPRFFRQAGAGLAVMLLVTAGALALLW